MLKKIILWWFWLPMMAVENTQANKNILTIIKHYHEMEIKFQNRKQFFKERINENNSNIKYFLSNMLLEMLELQLQLHEITKNLKSIWKNQSMNSLDQDQLDQWSILMKSPDFMAENHHITECIFMLLERHPINLCPEDLLTMGLFTSDEINIMINHLAAHQDPLIKNLIDQIGILNLLHKSYKIQEYGQFTPPLKIIDNIEQSVYKDNTNNLNNLIMNPEIHKQKYMVESINDDKSIIKTNDDECIQWHHHETTNPIEDISNYPKIQDNKSMNNNFCEVQDNKSNDSDKENNINN